jgi:asparagine synthase (glutamine-hydrolysing)
MFAFCLWDRETGRMHLARDRTGEKPLYFGYAGALFAVASEARAFRVLPSFEGRIDRNALASMTRFLAVPAPQCIYEGFASLPPGHWLTVDVAQVRRREMPRTIAYWTPSARAREVAGHAQPFASDAEAVDALERCVSGAVTRQMISDVPLGAFLSGGVDSSLVVALMQAEARRTGSAPVQTFAIGFDQGGYDEAPHARRVAAHLGTRHAELYVSDAECLALVPKMAALYDEPFADASQIGVYLVSRMARERVAVALTGDGGDELFGGYNRYIQAPAWWRRSSRIPQPLRKLIGAALRRISPVAADRMACGLSHLLPARMQVRRPSDRLDKLVEMLDATDPRQLYLGLAQQWPPGQLVLGAGDTPTLLDGPWPALASPEEQMMMLDLSFILPTALLTKVDRAAMAVSLETRAPFLDPSVMEFAWQLPLSSKIRGNQGKWLLRQLLYRHVPASLVERPKMGFDVPVGHWLKGPLRAWAEALLDASRLRDEGFFDVAAVRKCWQEHVSNRRNHADKLWAVLMFQSWHESNRPAGYSPRAR